MSVQIQAYLDNVFDVGGLLEDAETKNVALEKVEELEEHLSHVRTIRYSFLSLLLLLLYLIHSAYISYNVKSFNAYITKNDVEQIMLQ